MATSSNNFADSRALVTDKLVNEALKKDIGNDANLVSWKCQDFTNPGDNYCSFVTSIVVKYKLNGNEEEISYIAKLNPLRPPNPLVDMLELMFGREATVLHEVCFKMSEHLVKLDLEPLKVPKIYAFNEEKRKEMLMLEDFRRDGFVMFDRFTGMDLNHAKLVIKELGRYHASSWLFERSLPQKSIIKEYPQLEEPWMDKSHPVNQIFGGVIMGAIDTTVSFLEAQPKYESCYKWFKKNYNEHFDRFIDFFNQTDILSVFSHGDCWNNNILFKYGKPKEPSDVRLVDLQVSRTAPFSLDINYFLYTSVDGTTRKNHMKYLLEVYYQSFANVCKAAKVDCPISFDYVEKNVTKTKLFGMYAASLILPMMMTKQEDVIDFFQFNEENIEQTLAEQKENFALAMNRGDDFKNRFCNLFDDMLEAGVLE